MELQFLTNSKGEKTSVLIPFDEWQAINKEREDLIQQLKEADLLLRFRNAFSDAKLFEQGKLETRPIADLLNEL